MGCDLVALCWAARDPAGLAGFWGGLLGWDAVERPVGVELLPTDDTGFALRFLPTAEPKVLQNLMHFDLTSSSWQAQEATVSRVLELGGRHLDIGQGPEDEHVVMADPEGNELCVIEPGNNFLADCGFIGAVSSDGPQAVGRFWSAALGWPLVWDQDQETAIRSPAGGPKITWGGPPLMPRPPVTRQHYDLVPAPGADATSETQRLVGLGARVLRREDDRVVLADPDGNDFCLLTGAGAGS